MADIGPADASDITTLEQANAEIARLKKILGGSAVSEDEIQKCYVGTTAYYAPPYNRSQYGGVSKGDGKDTDKFKYFTYETLPKWNTSGKAKHKSLMAKYVTPEMFAKYKDVKTKKGYTLSNLMQTGVETPHLGVGATAGDEESWETFKEILYPIINGWHKWDPATSSHKSDLNPANLKFSDEQKAKFNKYVVSTRIRAARNIRGFSLPCGADTNDRNGVETTLTKAFSAFEGDLKGTYYPLGKMTDEQRTFLRSNGYLFQLPKVTNLLTNGGAARSWPDGRGIFHNEKQTALCWVNEEDHCRIISMSKDGDVHSVFSTFCNLSNALAESFKKQGTEPMFSEKLGFLGTCASNIGTGLRGGVMIKLEQLNKDVPLLEKICAENDLQPRGSSGEHSAAVGGKWDISNKQRIGFTEVELVQKMIDGVTKIIALEEELAAKAGGK